MKVKLNSIEKTAPKPQPDCKLLSLPPELRNQIFEYCLKAEYLPNTSVIPTVDDNVCIQVTENLKMPALASTCRQLYQEARKIWLFTNDFHVLIHDCDATVFLAWSVRVKALEGTPDCGNHRIILVAQNIAKQSRGLPRTKCEKVLDLFRMLAGDVSPLWLDSDSDSDSDEE